MEIKGELKRNGLPSLFRNFATENFHGVLTITSDVGEKLITLTENEVTIYCDEMNEASRLGNVLLGRNQITEELLDETLRDQRKLEPRPKLGDMLVMRGLVTEKSISDARRFQIEEDICDILSWKKARFNFAGSDSAREIHPEDFAAEQVHRLTIDPDTFFKFVTTVTEQWDAIGDRLPTQYLCFKLSQKVDESLDELSSESQRVLRYLKEGRTVEGVVKQSCLGRVEVCGMVIDLLERGLILPVSGADLRFMASEHRAQKRFHDALYIYRRLLESPDSKDDRPYLENLIEEICEQIIRMKQSGGYGEEAVVFSHRIAKEKYIQGKRRKMIFLGAAAFAIIVTIGVVFIYREKPAENLPQRYRDTIAQVDTLVASGKFNAAIKELDALYDSLPDKESHAASGIQARKERIPGQIHNYIENQLPVLERLAQRGGEEGVRGIHDLRELNEEYPQNLNAQAIRDLIAKYDEKKVEKTEIVPEIKQPVGPIISHDELVERMQKADALKQQKKFGDAKREYVSITQQAPAAGDIWKTANEAAKSIDDIGSRVRDMLEQADLAQKAKQGEKAIELVDKSLEIVGDLDEFFSAQKLRNFLLARKSQAQQMFKKAKELEDKNRVFEARDFYEQIAENYSEFPISAEARTKASALKSKADELRSSLLAALDAVEKHDFKTARKLYKPLLQLNEQLLIDQHVELPVEVSSVPAGSLLKVNGKTVGPTPKDVFIPAGTEYVIVVERAGYMPKKVAGDRIKDQLDFKITLDLDPVTIDLPPNSMGRAPSALLAPPIWFENHLLVLNGPDLVALDPPDKDVKFSVPGLYDPRAPVPEGAALDDRNYWNCLLSPMSYKPGFLLLPLRTRELMEIDLRVPEKVVRRSLFAHLTTPPPEIVGNVYVEEHSKLAGQSLLVAPFADGQVRCFVDFDKDLKYFNPRWTLPLDPQDELRREKPAAGLFGHRGLVWVLSGGGLLQAFDPIESEPIFKKQYKAMSVRSTFSSVPKDSLAAFVQRNGKVILFDLDLRREVWTLPERAAMEEAVGVIIDDTGVFVTSRKENYDELSKYPRTAGADGRVPPPEWTVKLDGYVSLEMARRKHVYMVTQNKVFAYSKTDPEQVWEFKLKSDMGEPRSIRAFGENVYVSTDKGKVIVLKAE